MCIIIVNNITCILLYVCNLWLLYNNNNDNNNKNNNNNNNNNKNNSSGQHDVHIGFAPHHQH